MELYYGGAEQKMWRELLHREGVNRVSLSYVGLRRRIKDPSKWRISDNFPPELHVHLSPGTSTLNKADDTDRDEAWDLGQSYMDFVEANIDAIEFASEFDATVLGLSTIDEWRDEFWSKLPGDKWMPVWHSEYGVADLRAMAETYDRLGVLQGDAGQDISPVLRQIAGQTKLHGVSMTSMDAMREIPWSSVATGSWLNVTTYGETFVWTGRELKWYPKKSKDQARKRHRTWLADQGFDMEKIEADDNAELLRLSVWSWQRFAASLAPRGVTTMTALPFSENEERPLAVVDTQGGSAGNAELMPTRARKLLPVLGVTTHTVKDADGNDVEEERFSTPSTSLLRCDSCFMREKCPEMTPGSECAFEIPAKVRTVAQLAAVQDWLIETQTQRVAFMRLVEQAEGGYADANLTAEMNNLARMIKAKNDVGKEGFSINNTFVAPPSGPGVMSQFFGSTVAERVGELPAPVDARDVMDVEIVE